MFKAIFGFKARLKSARDTQDLVSENKQDKQTKTKTGDEGSEGKSTCCQA